MEKKSTEILPKEERVNINEHIHDLGAYYSIWLLVPYHKALESAESEIEELKEKVRRLDRVLNQNAEESQKTWEEQKKEIDRLNRDLKDVQNAYKRALLFMSMSAKYLPEKFYEGFEIENRKTI